MNTNHNQLTNAVVKLEGKDSNVFSTIAAVRLLFAAAIIPSWKSHLHEKPWRVITITCCKRVCAMSAWNRGN